MIMRSIAFIEVAAAYRRAVKYSRYGYMITKFDSLSSRQQTNKRKKKEVHKIPESTGNLLLNNKKATNETVRIVTNRSSHIFPRRAGHTNR